MTYRSGDPATTHARVTLAISDQCPGGLEGFAPLSDALPASVFHDATEDADHGGFHAIFVDLMDGDYNQIGEKCVSLDQAAEILGMAPESLIPLGRQRLAQINDEAAAYVMMIREAPQ